VILGSNQPIPENVLQKALYLGVKVNTDPEMQPRQVITSSLFAMRAGVAETVVKGVITSDSLSAGSVTADKVADGAVNTQKLSATAVTGDKIAPNAVTGDKINNGTITNDKLSSDVQQKLEQSGQMPSSVETLNVTYQLKVGTNSMYLGQNDAGATNSIYTDDSALLMQSAGKNKDTLINANGDNGKVGIGTTNAPKAKLDVKGPVKISPIAQAEFTDSFWLNFDTGLLMFYNDTLKTGEINSLNLGGTGGYSDLSLNGKNIFLNEKQSASLKVPAGNVGIGLLSGTTPKAKLDVAGGIRTNKGDSIQGDGANVGYAFESDGDTGMFSYGGTTTGGSTLAFKVDNSRMLGIGRWGVSIGETWENNLPEGTGGGLARFFLTPKDAGYSNFWLNGNNFRWDDTAKKFKRDEATYNGFRGFMFFGDHTTHFIHADYWNTTNEWTFDELQKLARYTITGNAFGINKYNPSYDYALDVGGRVRATGFVPPSDKRWKQDIKPLENVLDKLYRLQGVSYYWNTKEYPDMNFDDKLQIGFIAQEVEPVFPELVSTDEKGYKGVEYDKMTVILVEAVKELKAQNDALKAIVCKDHPQEAICR